MKKIILIAGILVAFTMCFSTVKAATEADIQAAIDDGLAWLAAKQNTTPGPDSGSWGTYHKIGKTGLAVKKFEHDAILKGFSSPFDPTYPYHQVVEDGLNFLFANAGIVTPLPVQPAGDPDTDGDGIGVAFAGGETYETGIALMAIAETNTPDRVVDAPGSPVNGWTYYDVAEDAMNWLAFAQVDTGYARGSWGYEDNYGGDQSNSGYATLGLAFAEAASPHGFGLSAPQFVKNELNLWIDYIQIDVDGSQFDGGSAYYRDYDTIPPYQTVNILQTGNLLFEMAWYGDNSGTQRVQDAIGYIVRHWTDGGYSWPDSQGWYGQYQAMFTLMKGLEAFGIDQIDGIDWFDEVSDSIVATQHANGSWGPDFWDDFAGGDTVLSTTWALLTLQKVTPEIIISIELDIKPQSCPNPFNTKSQGKLPVAILGTEDFDVMEVDPATVLLEGVPPLRWNYKDVSRPVDPRYDDCDCTPDGADGYMDLTLKFNHQEILDSIAPVYDGEVRILTLTGMTYDSIPIEGHDCVVILPPSLCIPTLISPEEGAIMDNGRTDGLDDVVWDFDWSDCPGATEYHLYVKLPNALNPLIDNQGITSSSYHYVSSGYIPDANRLGWTWKVGVKVDGMWHRWTETRTFDVEPVNTDPPSSPKLSGEMASGFSLGSNYPNPFNPETDISFSLPERTEVSFIIYNILGEKVKTLVSGDMDAGTHTIHWNGRDEAGNAVASGIYFYRLKTDSFDQTRKMVLMK